MTLYLLALLLSVANAQIILPGGLATSTGTSTATSTMAGSAAASAVASTGTFRGVVSGVPYNAYSNNVYNDVDVFSNMRPCCEASGSVCYPSGSFQCPTNSYNCPPGFTIRSFNGRIYCVGVCPRGYRMVGLYCYP